MVRWPRYCLPRRMLIGSVLTMPSRSPYGDGLGERLRAAAGEGIESLHRPLRVPNTSNSRSIWAFPETVSRRSPPFEKAQEFGVKAEGSVTASTPEILTEMAEPCGFGRRRDSNCGHVSARSSGGCLCGVGTSPHPREDRAYSLIEPRTLVRRRHFALLWSVHQIEPAGQGF